MKNLKIRTRLIVSFALVVLFTLIITVAALIGLKITNNNLQEFIKYPYAANAAIKECMIESNIAARTVREMVLETDNSKYPKYKEQIAASLAIVQENIVILKDTYQAEDNLVAQYEEKTNAWATSATQIMLQAEQNNNEVATNMILTQCAVALAEMSAIAEQLDVNLQEIETATLTKGTTISNVVSIAVFALLAVSIVISAVLAVSTTVAIVRPLRQVQEAATEMSKGNLRYKITYDSKNEVGIVAQALKSSMATLSSYVQDIDVALATMSDGDFNIAPTVPFIGDFENIERSFISFSTKMSQTLEQINIAADQVSSGSDQVSSGAQALSQGATEQASAIEELSATIAEITEQIKQNAQNVKNANVLIEATAKEVNNGHEKMQSMVGAMKDISEKSGEISKIIKTIDDIAFQTNILALNAAVEAARAGSAGKGFAVVADEVRNLAQKSAEAAKVTTELIEGSILAVDNGERIAAETAGSLEVIVVNAKQISATVDEISDASDQQAEGAGQITVGVDQIASVIQTNSATAEESAAASEELSSQATLLKGLVSDFKLREGSV